MIRLITFILLCCLQYSSKSQSISCNDLISYAQTNGYLVGNVSPLTSSMISSAKCYSIEGTYVVIADIKRDGSYYSDTYIFCDVPQSNWQSFSSTCIGNCSHGERFHNLIINYKCDCY